MSTEKSYVTMEQKQCFVCGELFETNALLLDRRLRERFDRYTVTGTGICPKDQERINDDYIILIGVKNKTGMPDGTMKPEDAERTGEIAYIKNATFTQLFNIPAPEKKVGFVDQEVMTKLQDLRQGADEQLE